MIIVCDEQMIPGKRYSGPCNNTKGELYSNMPMLVIREATFEEYRQDVINNGGVVSRHMPLKDDFYYLVSLD